MPERSSVARASVVGPWPVTFDLGRSLDGVAPVTGDAAAGRSATVDRGLRTVRVAE